MSGDLLKLWKSSNLKGILKICIDQCLVQASNKSIKGIGWGSRVAEYDKKQHLLIQVTGSLIFFPISIRFLVWL